jgi:hypothetical protein
MITKSEKDIGITPFPTLACDNGTIKISQEGDVNL